MISRFYDQSLYFTSGNLQYLLQKTLTNINNVVFKLFNCHILLQLSS